MLTVAHLSICEDDGGVHQFREQDAVESSRVRVQPAQVRHFGPYFLHDQVAVLCSKFSTPRAALTSRVGRWQAQPGLVSEKELEHQLIRVDTAAAVSIQAGPQICHYQKSAARMPQGG